MVENSDFTRPPSKTPFEREDLESICVAVEDTVKGQLPVYVYFEEELIKNARTLKSSFVNTNIRFAMKASSNRNILKIFEREGLHFDCSSIYEVERVIAAGIDPSRIELVA